MRSTTVFADRFRKSLDKIRPEIMDRVNRRGGLSEERLLQLVLNPEDHRIKSPGPVAEADLHASFDEEKCKDVGDAAVQRGEVAYCVLAGGAGTRIGEPKALLEAPHLGESLLSIKLKQAPSTGPIWVVTSPSLLDRVSAHVRSVPGVDQSRVKVIEQYESYRLTPDNQVKFAGDEPDLYPCGHGDVFASLVESGTLSEFCGSGGVCVQVSNVDNVLASLDPVLVGKHLELRARVSFEVVKRLPGDSGGFLCDVHGARQIVEGFRIAEADLDEFAWLNTNTFVFDASLDLRSIGNFWNRIQKNVCGELLVQHERLSQEITEAYDTSYVAANRSKRFFPIKSANHLLELNRQLLT